RVIRGVHDHRPSPGRDSPGNGLDIEVESHPIDPGPHRYTMHEGDHRLVKEPRRALKDYFIARVEDRGKGYHEGARGTPGHEDVVTFKRDLEPAAEGPSSCVPGRRFVGLVA